MEAVLKYVGLLALLVSLFHLGYTIRHNRFKMSVEVINSAYKGEFVMIDVVCINRSGLQFSIVSLDYCLNGHPVKCELSRDMLPSTVAPYEARRLLLHFPVQSPKHEFAIEKLGDRPSDTDSDLIVYTSRGKYIQRVKVCP